MEDRQSLTARARDVLRALLRGPIPYRHGRNMPMEYRELTSQGLAFQSHTHLSITRHGEDAAERCT